MSGIIETQLPKRVESPALDRTVVQQGTGVVEASSHLRCRPACAQRYGE